GRYRRSADALPRPGTRRSGRRGGRHSHVLAAESRARRPQAAAARSQRRPRRRTPPSPRRAAPPRRRGATWLRQVVPYGPPFGVALDARSGLFIDKMRMKAHSHLLQCEIDDRVSSSEMKEAAAAKQIVTVGRPCKGGP